MTGILAAVAAVLVSWAGTGLVRMYAVAQQVMDVPNSRSSHAVPTPRGGGLAIVAATIVIFGLLAGGAGAGRLRLLLPLVGILVVAWIGWKDDTAALPPAPRLLAHIGGSLTLLPLVLAPEPIPGWMGPIAIFWWAFWGVSAINVINFMDGIDGLIGGQILVFGLHLALMGGASGAPGIFGLILAGAALGFLGWNWPPAKIFMGDVGSGALGLAVVFGGALLMRSGGVGLMAAFLPLFPLFLDALVTLVRRAMRGEPITQPHRTHLYQRLANGGWGHARVSLLFGLAAVVGAVVARVAVETVVGPALVVGYLSFTVLTGVLLDRSAPPAHVVPSGVS